MNRFQRALALGLLFVFSLANAEDAANFSGLKNQELKPVGKGGVPADPKDIKKINLSDLLGGLRSGGKKDKDLKINRVTVLEDRRTMLRIRFEYETTKTPMKVTLWALSKGGKPVEDITCPPISLTEANGEMETTLSLKPRPPAVAAPFPTIVLQFGVGKGGTLDALIGGIGNGPAFLCDKNWEPVPTIITAKPFGAAVTASAKPAGTGSGVVLKPIAYEKASILANSTKLAAIQMGAEPKGEVAFTKAATIMKRPWMLDGVRIGTGGGAPPPPPGMPAPKGPGTMLVFSPKELQSSAPAFTDDLPLVFEDAEAGSGYYYYKPNRFALSWSAQGDYAFKMIYGAAGTEGAAKGVTLAVRMGAPVSGNDLAMITKMLGDAGKKVVALRPFPIGTPPTYNLIGALKSYGISPENVFVTGASEQGDEMEVRIVTDALTKETLQTLMTEGLGLAGDVLFDSAKTGGGAEPVKVSIPATIRFADTLSFGSRPVVRQDGNRAPFTNDTPYPVMLQYVNILRIVGTDRTIYNYSLGPVELQPGESVQVDLSSIPAWMDSDPGIRRRWFQFSVMPDSMATDKILGIATGGADQTTQTNIALNILQWKEKVPAIAIRIEFRSRYFDSKRTTVLTKDYTVKGDGETAQIGPLYLPAKLTGNYYEYRLTVVDADGNEKVAKKWMSSDKSSLFIGLKQIKDVLDEPPVRG